MKLLLLLVTFFIIPAFSQTDWVKWEKADYSYQIENNSRDRSYSFASTGVGDFAGKVLINTYWFFISDVDGANCPFNPTCSSFLVQSISETNPIQGLLMSFDRFTRDTNIYGRQEHYPRFGNTHFYDPITLYTLDEKKINFIPATTYINEE